MHKNILCICALCARVWGTLRAQTPESCKTESRCVVVKASDEPSRSPVKRQERMPGRRAYWGRGKNVSKRGAPRNIPQRAFPPSPFTTNGRRGGRRAAEAAPRARRRLLPAGQEKPREAAPVPLHHERAGEADEGQPKRRRAAGLKA